MNITIFYFYGNKKILGISIQDTKVIQIWLISKLNKQKDYKWRII